MTNKKHKRRLRKQVLFAIPAALLIATLIICFISFSSRTFSSEVKTINLQDSYTEPVIDYQNDYIDLFNKQMEIRKKDNTVIYYAQKFKLNINKTLEIVHNYTENYTNEEYKKNFVIGPDWIKQKEGSFTSEEAGIAYFVRDLYRYPEYYGSSIPEIRTSEISDTNHTIRDGRVYTDNGLTYEQYLGRLADMYGLEKNITLAISYLETGYLSSGLFTLSNNVGGQRGYGGWMNYTTLEAGMLGHVIALRAIVRTYGIDMTSENAILDLSSIYVNGHAGNPSYDWTWKVTNIVENIKNQDLFTIQ